MTSNAGQVTAELIALEIRDYDTDGLEDHLEAVTGTFPWDADTDDDGLIGGPVFSED